MDKLMNEIHESVVTWMKQIELDFRNGKYSTFNVDTKVDYKDLVTDSDKKIEHYFSTSILEKFPNSVILGEETYSPNKDYSKSDLLWVIDPIDGTRNFVKQAKDFAVMVSVFYKNEPTHAYIYDLAADVLYYAVEGKGFFVNSTQIVAVEDKPLQDSFVSIDYPSLQISQGIRDFVSEAFDMRYIGSAGLDGARVAAGDFGAYVCKTLQPWDFAPFFLISKLLGLHMSNFDGAPLTLTKPDSFILCTEAIYGSWKKYYV